MTPGTKRLAGIGCVVLLVAYGAFLVVFFKTMPAHLAASNDIRSKIKWTTNFCPDYGEVYSFDDAGKIYSNQSFGKVTCLNPDGTVNWESNSFNESQSGGITLAFSVMENGKVASLVEKYSLAGSPFTGQTMSSSGTYEIYIFDSKGTVSGKHALPMVVSVAGFVASQEQVYILDVKGVVFSFDLDGNLLWQYSTPNPTGLTNLTQFHYGISKSRSSHLGLIPTSNLLTVYHLGSLTILNYDGSVFSQDTSTNFGTTQHFRIGANSEMYFAGLDLMAMDSKCKTIWSVPLGNPSLPVPVTAMEIGNDGNINIILRSSTSSNSEIICFNPNGNERWRSAVSNQCTLLAVANDGTVYAGGNLAGLYSIDSLGTQNWHLQYSKFNIQTLQVSPDGTILISDFSRTLALEP